MNPLDLLDPARASRVLAAVKECNDYLRVEEARADDLRPDDAKVLVSFYRAHRERLRNLASEALCSVDCRHPSFATLRDIVRTAGA